MEMAKQLKLAAVQRANGKLSEASFKRIRLLNGVYLQLHAHMLRVGVVCGVLCARQLRALALVSCKYDRGVFHVTTRQNVQLNWLSAWDAVKASEALAKFELCSARTAGCCVRHITCDPLHDVGVDQTADVAAVVKTLTASLTFNASLTRLPKKVKVCVWSGSQDRVLGLFHDVGVRLAREWAYVTVGGGLGREPAAGCKLVKLRTNALARWLIAFLKVYAALASSSARCLRTKALVASLGKATIVKLTKPAAERVVCDGHVGARSSGLESVSIAASASTISWPSSDEFERWYAANTLPHKLERLRIVEIGCSAQRAPPGDVTAGDVEALATAAQRYSMDEARLTASQTIVLPYVSATNLKSVHALCAEFEVTGVACCPGADYCALASARSILVAQKLALLKCGLQIRVSGCVNACSHHHVFDIGVIGVNKAGLEAYQLVAGGSAPAGALCRVLCRALPAFKVAAAVARYAALIRCLKKDSFESAHACFARHAISLGKRASS
ncbi:putative sulfite reductase hemoprotein subunit [Candidatus Hodgkinia cicadicola Dsem]|nr:putative sulfite reductase hemoprotein subunit [Candidatus Hodgkinia cicadicola Dsem]